MLLRIDEQGPLPIHRQIYEQIQTMIQTHALLPGAKLPSTRQLANTLNIHRSTVAIAYQELWASGQIHLDPRRCPTVRAREQVSIRKESAEDSTISWIPAYNAASSAALESYHALRNELRSTDPSAINFSRLSLDTRLFPMESFRSTLHRVMMEGDAGIFGYVDSEGYRPLREWVSRHLKGRGINASPEEIMITNGSQHSFDLILRLLATPGGSVAIESPTYDEIFPLLRLAGLRPIGIPMLADGMDLSVLADVLQRERPVLVYTMPSFQNPTSISTSQQHRERLLALCMQHRVPILEDGFEEDMKYFGRAVLPIKSMDSEGLVFYCATLSRVLFPGLRIGWLVAHRECIDHLASVRHYTGLSSSGLLQAAVHTFGVDGSLDRHISRMHRVFRRRMQTAIRVLHRDIPTTWAEWDDPSGGYLIWLRLRPTKAPVEWDAILTKHRIKAVLGDRFFTSPQPNTYLRLSIAGLNEEEITEGIRRLAVALAEVYGGDD
ncbi:MAG: PLP-dependent aminotransferase family protein [Bacillota bacterium]